SACVLTISHSTVASASLNTGWSCRPLRQLPLEKRAGPCFSHRKVDNTSLCSSPSTLATKRLFASSDGTMDERSSIKKPTSGGSAEIEVRLETIKPATPSPLPVVTAL